jgi:hypothetical protein
MRPVRMMLFAAAMVAPAAAYADNDCQALAPQVEPSPVIVHYDPFNAAATQQDFNVDVRTNTSCPNRNIFLQVDSDNPGVTDGHVITATGPGGITIQATLTNRSSNNGAGRGDTFNVKSGIQSLYFVVERGQVVPPGDYHAPLIAEERLDNGNNPPGENVVAAFELIITVGPAVGLAPAIGTQIDLGELSNNDTAAAPVQFDAYANVDYELEIVSDHDFNLLRGGQAGGAAIAYAPLLDSAALPTSAPRRDFDRPLGVDSRRRHTLNVNVPSIAGKPAGEYEDVLTVQISAKVGG